MKAAACVAIVALALGFVSAQAPAPTLNATATPAATPAGALPGALPATAPPAVNATGTSPAPTPTATVSPSPSPSTSPSPSPAPVEAVPAAATTAPAGTVPAANTTEEPAAGNATANATANTTATGEPVAANATKPANTTKAANITNTQISAYFSSPLFAIQNTPELKELAKLGAGSQVAKLLNNKTLIATIFAPNNEAVTRAVQFVANATGVDAKSLAEHGVVEQLLTYHVAEGAAVLEGKFKNKQNFTMLDGNKTTILVEEPVEGARKLLQAGNATYYIVSDSNQKIQLTSSANIQGGKCIIHVIDGVLVPQALLDQYNITDTAQLPGLVPTNATIQAAPVSTSREVTPMPTTSTPGTNSAATAAAALLAVPALLAAVML